MKKAIHFCDSLRKHNPFSGALWYNIHGNFMIGGVSIMMKLYGADDHLLALTNTIDANFHQHSFIQVSISIESCFEIEFDENRFNCRGIIIDSNVSHRFNGDHNLLLFLLIDSTSHLAEPFKKRIDNQKTYTFPDDMLNKVTAFVKNSSNSIVDSTSYNHFLTQLLFLFSMEYAEPTPTDQRIIEVINLLKDCNDSEHSVDIFAKQVNLSNSRLSHLFKESTGMTLSGYLVLHKLQKAIYLIFNGMIITDAALSAGFDSPSHFAATSKRLLGMSAKDISKDSVFLKVSRYQ